MTRTLLAFALALVALLIPTAPGAWAQGKAAAGQATVTAVIDMQRIVRDAAAFRDARNQLEQRRSAWEGDLAKEEERLRKEEQDLVRQRQTLTPDAFDKRRSEFERKVTDFQRRRQDRSVALEQAFDKARADIGRGVVEIVSVLVQERGYNLVLDKSQVVFHAVDMEITDEVLRRLDQKMPTVKIQIAGGAAPAPAKQ